MRIPIFRLKYDLAFREEFQRQSQRIFDEGFLTNHSFVREFEEKFARWAGAPYAVATSSGTSALETILRAVNVRNREVIVPANTFMATATAVQNAGGIPVVVDIEPEYLSLSPRAARLRVTAKTAAIVTVHVGGMISPSVFELQKICSDHGLALIEDCAHAHGAHLDGIPAGSFGIAGAFSFHTTKVMTTGEGGAIVCKSASLDESLRSSRQFGCELKAPLLHRQQGGNAKMSEMHALMGLLELKRVDRRIEHRQALARRYQERLHGSSWRAFKAPASSRCPYYKQIIASPLEWTSVRDFLKSEGISLTGGVYHYPLNQQPALGLGEVLPVADQFSRFHICPPCYPELELHEVDEICDQLLRLQG